MGYPTREQALRALKEEQGVCMVSSSDSNPDHVSNIAASLETAIMSVVAQRDRLRKAMDYVLGGAPTGVDNATCKPSRAGFVGQIEEGFIRLRTVQNEVDEEICRLERVVG